MLSEIGSNYGPFGVNLGSIWLALDATLPIFEPAEAYLWVYLHPLGLHWTQLGANNSYVGTNFGHLGANLGSPRAILGSICCLPGTKFGEFCTILFDFGPVLISFEPF